jgi:hypothetical protein
LRRREIVFEQVFVKVIDVVLLILFLLLLCRLDLSFVRIFRHLIVGRLWPLSGLARRGTLLSLAVACAAFYHLGLHLLDFLVFEGPVLRELRLLLHLQLLHFLDLVVVVFHILLLVGVIHLDVLHLLSQIGWAGLDIVGFLETFLDQLSLLIAALKMLGLHQPLLSFFAEPLAHSPRSLILYHS